MVGLLTCAGDTERQLQYERVEKAQTSVKEENAYLQSLRDSLPVKIQQNINMGIQSDKAESVEQALIKMQETVVGVAEHNLLVQKSFLDSLAKYNP
jgi:hypothetical protein